MLRHVRAPARPLKLGLHLDIIAALGERIDRRLLRQALRCYTSNIHYRASQKPGAPRIDLDGNASGTVSEADAQSAAKDVASRKAALGQRKRPAVRPEIKSAAPPPPEPPRRDGLAAFGKQRSDGRQLHDVGSVQSLPDERLALAEIPASLVAVTGTEQETSAHHFFRF